MNAKFLQRLAAHLGEGIPSQFTDGPEMFRRAFLLMAFSKLALVFGGVFTLFYLVLEHYYGAVVVLVCTGLLVATPALLRRARSLDAVAHYQTSIFAFGFSIMCFLEGGLHGHAVAWLATAPLVGLLLLGIRGSLPWFGFSLIVMLAFILLDGLGYEVPRTYPPTWSFVVAAAGNSALLLFFYLLGLAFEQGRHNAQAQLEKALEELAQANRHLQQLNLEKNEFMGIAAHDLRNPLTSIMMNTELLKLGGAKSIEKVETSANKILRESTRMRDLINNLLDVNRIEEGRFDLALAPVDLATAAAQVVEDLMPMARAKGQTLLLNNSEDNAIIQADPKALHQILENFLSNAVKYSPSDSTIQVACRSEPDGPICEITDQGPGLSEEDQARLFGKFARLTPKPTGGESSTGLGLSIVKRLAENMEGVVGCRSREGEGSTFFVRFPNTTQ